MEKRIIFSMYLLLLFSFVIAQSDSIVEIKFHYDISGNRTSRDVVYYEGGLKSLSNLTELEEEEIDFTRELKIYPNPATHSIYVTLNDEAYKSGNKTVIVFDNLGRILKQIPVYKYVNQLDVSTLKDGTYILKLIYDDSHIEWVLIKN